MGTQYAGNDVFPADFTVPVAGDTESASAFGVALEALGDRTKSLHVSRTALADFGALRAIDTTSLPNGTVRLVKRQGLFTLDTASAETPDEPWVIAPTTGPGRWLGTVPHVTSRVVLVPGAAAKGITSADIAVGSRAVDVDFVPFTSSQIGFPDGQAQLLEVNTASAASKGFVFPISAFVLDGSTLTSVRCRFKPNPTHAALPLTLPAFGVRRVARTLATPPTPLKSTNSGFTDDPTTPVAAYNAEHDWSWTADQNNVIDIANYTYDIVAFYEGNTNALSNGLFVSWELTFTGRIPARAQP